MTNTDYPHSQPSSAVECEVSVVRSDVELEELRSSWDQLNWNPNAQYEFFRLINSVRPSVLRPHLIVLREQGDIKGLVVARVVQTMFTCALGYRNISLGQVRQLDVVHGGLLGSSAGSAANLVIDELLATLRRREVDVVNLSHVRADSDVYQRAGQKPGLGCRDHLRITQLHRKARLPSSLDAFLSRLSKKHRSWARRMERLLHDGFQGRVRYRSFADYGDLEVLANDLEEISKRTYQRELGGGFTRNSEHTQRLALGRREGWLRGMMLFVNDKPCAFWIGSVYKGVFYSEATGYDPDFRKFEVGTQVFLKLVESLCREGVAEIDFGLGDALYKQRFGDECWEDGSVFIFAPTLKARWLNLVRTGLQGPVQAGRRALDRLGLEQRLKTLWRKKLSGRQEL